MGLKTMSRPGVFTVDGSEIRRSPVVVGSLSHYLQGFIHLRWLFGISEPSTVAPVFSGAFAVSFRECIILLMEEILHHLGCIIPCK